MKARLRGLARRRVVWGGLGLASFLVLLAQPAAHADVWANVGPASPLGASGLDGRYPLGNYALDEHFTAVSAGVLSGVDVSGVGPMIAYFFANELWQLTAWLASALIDLFGFAFSLDLVNGSSATNGAGALAPVSRAIHSIYAGVFGGPWMVLAVSVAGCWAMWRALVQRRYAETAGRLALSLIYIGIALFFVLQPAQTIGTASGWTNEMSGAFLSIAHDGDPGSQEEAKQAGADQLFSLLVAEPWSVLEFGGVEHCVKAGGGEEPESVAVQPLPEEAARRLEAGEEVSAGGKTCIGDLKKYGEHFLRFAPGSDERNEEFNALQDGEGSKLPDADPSKEDGSYNLTTADKPAAAAMEEGGQYERLLVAIVVFACELGAFCLLGSLAVGVILAQVLLLLLLAFSPVALVAAAIPGRGHDFFRGWLTKLAGFLLRKAAYSLVLAVLLAVCAAIASATSALGWLMSFGLQSLFFWAVFVQRKALTESLIGIATGPGAPGREGALNVLALYSGARAGTRVATGPLRRAGRGARVGLGSARRRVSGRERVEAAPRPAGAAAGAAVPPAQRGAPAPGPGAAVQTPVEVVPGTPKVEPSGRDERPPGPRSADRDQVRSEVVPSSGAVPKSEKAKEVGEGARGRRASAESRQTDTGARREGAESEMGRGPGPVNRGGKAGRKRQRPQPKPESTPRADERPASGQPSKTPSRTLKGAADPRRTLAEELRAEKERASEAAKKRGAEGRSVKPPAKEADPSRAQPGPRAPMPSSRPPVRASRSQKANRQGKTPPKRNGRGKG